MKISKKIMKMLTLVLTFSMVLSLTNSSISAKVSDGSSYKATDVERLDAHVQKLSKEIGVRLAGTPNEKATAEYIKGELTKLGYDAEITEFASSGVVGMLKINGKEFYATQYIKSGESVALVDNPTIRNKSIAEPEEEDLFCIDEWKIEAGDAVVVNFGLFKKLAALSAQKALEDSTYTKLTENNFRDLAIQKVAEANGAVLIVYNDMGDAMASMFLMNPKAPVWLVTSSTGELLTNEKGLVTQMGTIQKTNSYNVQAVKKATTKEPTAIIHVTSHLDSVIASPGATDNASAVAAMIELARLYKDVDTKGVELRFIAFGSEESGLLGSKQYTANLTSEECAISLNFNMDMLSTTWDEADVVSLDINPSRKGVFNLAAALIIDGSTELNWIEGTKNVRWFQYGSSDHVSFYNKGIDATSMIRTKDIDDDCEPVNHTQKDSIADNYSKERLEECANMVSKGIARAIDNELTKVIVMDLNENNHVTVYNSAALGNLFNEVVYKYVNTDGAEGEIIGEKINNFAVTLPVGADLVSVTGVGQGTANVTGTYDKPKVETYVTGLVVKNASSVSADYTSVDEAIAKAETLDKNLYKDFSAVEKAVEEVIRGKNITEQAEVDAMAKAIENAIEALEYKAADYSAVDKAIAKAETLNKNLYKDFSAVEKAVKEVIRGKNITEQAEVDAMAKAIENAIEALEYKAADYSAVDKAIAKAETLDKNLYKDFSAVEKAVEGVIRGKNITEQAEVDAMAKAIENAITSLEKKTENNPDTYDNGYISLWITLMFISIIEIVGYVVYRKNKIETVK